MLSVDLTRCVGCGYCQMVCPVEALQVHGQVCVDEDLCTSCGICVTTCPMEALSVMAEENTDAVAVGSATEKPMSDLPITRGKEKGEFSGDAYDVIIIGSGPGGLFTGARLARAGYKVLVLEKSARPGGRKTQIPYKGFQIPTGSIHYHLYGDAGPETRTLRELGLDWKGIPCVPHTIWRIGNREYTMPEKGGMKHMFELCGCNARETERLLKVFGRAIKWKEPPDDIMFGDWLLQYTDNRMLWAMYDAWVANISGLGSDHVSAGEFFREMRCFSQPPTVIPGGNKGMIDALTGLVVRDGGEIYLFTNVRRIIIEDGVARGVVVETAAGKVVELKSRVVVSDAGPKPTVELGGRENFDSGFLKEVDALQPAGDSLIIVYEDDRPLFECAGYLSVPYEYGGTKRISTICLPGFASRELDAPGKYAHYFWSLIKGNKEEEIGLAIADMKNLYPKDFDEEKILLIQSYTREHPSYRCIPGTGLDTRTSVENLYMVGDGCSPSPLIGGEACAETARIVALDISSRVKRTS